MYQVLYHVLYVVGRISEAEMDSTNFTHLKRQFHRYTIYIYTYIYILSKSKVFQQLLCGKHFIGALVILSSIRAVAASANAGKDLISKGLIETVLKKFQPVLAARTNDAASLVLSTSTFLPIAAWYLSCGRSPVNSKSTANYSIAMCFWPRTRGLWKQVTSNLPLILLLFTNL